MKRFKVIWTKNAELDLELIIEYIKIDSIEIAKKIFIEIKQERNKLYTLPERKRVVPEFQQIGIVKYREIIYLTFAPKPKHLLSHTSQYSDNTH